MTAWDSTYLLKMFNRKAARPSTDNITPADKYERLSEAQNAVIAQMMAVVPNSLYPKGPTGALPQLTTADNQVFRFGTDTNGYPIYPLGKARIFRSPSDLPDSFLREGVDFLNEGTQIRMPNNTTYGGPLYWYGARQPSDITADSEPALFPEASRVLIVIDAVRTFAQEGVRNGALEDDMQAEWDRQWPQWCLTWKSQYNLGGALAYSGLGLALAGQSSFGGIS